MPILYDYQETIQPTGITIPWGYLLAFGLGLFIGLPVGREIIKTSLGITEREIRKKLAEARAKR